MVLPRPPCGASGRWHSDKCVSSATLESGAYAVVGVLEPLAALEVRYLLILGGELDLQVLVTLSFSRFSRSLARRAFLRSSNSACAVIGSKVSKVLSGIVVSFRGQWVVA